MIQTFETDCQMSAALVAGQRMHFIDDDGLDPSQRLMRLAGEHQEQRFGSGDQDVWWLAAQPPSFGCECVARTNTYADLSTRGAQPLGGAGDAGQGCSKVAFDVDSKRLEWRYVENTGASGRIGWNGRGHQAIDCMQECAEGLAATGRRNYQRVGALGDRCPGALLSWSGVGEGCFEPGFRRAVEVVEGKHVISVSSGCDMGWTPCRSILRGRSQCVSRRQRPPTPTHRTQHLIGSDESWCALVGVAESATAGDRV